MNTYVQNQKKVKVSTSSCFNDTSHGYNSSHCDACGQSYGMHLFDNLVEFVITRPELSIEDAPLDSLEDHVVGVAVLECPACFARHWFHGWMSTLEGIRNHNRLVDILG